jgi:phosphate transport system substrate-binding protein
MTLFLFFSIAAYTDHSIITNRPGQSFSDPSQIMDMPSDWMQMPVKYDPEIGEADIVVNLDQHIYPVLLPLIQQFAEGHHIKVAVSEGTCGTAAGLLSRKAADVGGFCCPPDKTDRFPGLRFHTYGIAALALLVHPDNPVDNITTDEARKVFAGEIVSWAEIESGKGEKGREALIQPVTRLHCKLRPGHWRLMLDDQDLFSPRILDVGAIPDMVYNIASNKNAIGFEILWNVKRFRERGVVKPLKLNGYSPSDKEAVASHKYPFYEVFSLSTWEGKGVENPWAQKLVAYILEQSGEFSGQYYFVPVSRLKKAGWKFSGNELIGEPE